jgi:hypothetical protein
MVQVAAEAPLGTLFSTPLMPPRVTALVVRTTRQCLPLRAVQR